MQSSTIATLLIAALSAGAPAAAQTAAAPEPVVVVVDITTPPGISDAAIRAGMAKSVPQYRALTGLIRKYFTLADGHFGGVYYWSSRAAADAWFNDAWHARVIKTYGRDADVRVYAVPIAIDGERP